MIRNNTTAMARTHTMKSGKGRILFVEDEKNLISLYHIFFEKYGYDFLSANDIADALALTEFEQPDVVLLDIIIPKLVNGVYDIMAEQGYDYLSAVKKNPKTKKIPIIVFTNLNTIKDRVKSGKMGAISFVVKSQVTPKEMLSIVEEVIKQDKTKNEVFLYIKHPPRLGGEDVFWFLFSFFF